MAKIMEEKSRVARYAKLRAKINKMNDDSPSKEEECLSSNEKKVDLSTSYIKDKSYIKNTVNLKLDDISDREERSDEAIDYKKQQKTRVISFVIIIILASLLIAILALVISGVI